MFSSQQDLQTNLEYIREAGVAHMMTVYKTDNRVLHEVEEMDPGVWIMMTNPTMEESQEVAEKYDIDMVDVRAALDEEESSRIELEDGYTLILVDIPAMEIRHESKNYTTIPLGILLTQECIITVCTEETPILQHFIERRVREFSTKKKMRFVYQILFRTSAMYQSTLRIIDKKIEEGDKWASLVFDNFAYQLGKYIGSYACVLNGQVDAIVMTGGCSKDEMFIEKVKEHTGWIAPMIVYGGDFEMEALASGAVRALNGEEELKEYTGVPVWSGFDFEPETI